MLHSFLRFLIIAAMVLSGFFSVSYADSMPLTIDVGAESLTLNGDGIRKKLFISVYNTGLYLGQKSAEAEAIIQNDALMAIRIEIISSLITSSKMEQATREGFEKSTGGNTTPIEQEIDTFIQVFKSDINVGDVFMLLYQPDKGVAISKNGEKSSVVPGLHFKKALFGIWLSKDPIQNTLKEALLGQG